MNIIAFRAIREFYDKHPTTINGLRSWYTILKNEEWNFMKKYDAHIQGELDTCVE